LVWRLHSISCCFVLLFFYFLFDWLVGFEFLRLGLTMSPRLASKSQSSHLRLLSAGIIGGNHHAQISCCFHSISNIKKKSLLFCVHLVIDSKCNMLDLFVASSYPLLLTSLWQMVLHIFVMEMLLWRKKSRSPWAIKMPAFNLSKYCRTALQSACLSLHSSEGVLWSFAFWLIFGSYPIF
jgi:hypothetical protein